MWLLRGDNGSLIYLKPNHTSLVGRTRGDIILSDDQSISRVHARITVTPVADFSQIEDSTTPLSTCTIEDPGSKYGNFMLPEGSPQIQISRTGHPLRHMDRIRFGLQNYIFTVVHVPIITATSALNQTEKGMLESIIDSIDGKIVYNWNTICTHMTVSETPTVSEKLSCALADCTPIVNIVYWRAVLRAFENNEALPDPVAFADPINAKMSGIGNVCVRPNPMRKTCVPWNPDENNANATDDFICHFPISAGGISFRDGKQPTDLNPCAANVVVVQLVESNTTQATGSSDANYAAICERLRSSRRRTIPESEIALAILHCSTTKYCNPLYDYADLIRNRRSQHPESDSPILALDTQDVDLPTSSVPQGDNQNNIVNESSDRFTESEDPRILGQNLVDDRSESTASSSYNGDSMGSIKLVSLNYEKYIEEEFEFKRPTTSADSAPNQNRAKGKQFGSVTSKVNLDVAIEDEKLNRKPSVSVTSQESEDDWMDSDAIVHINEEDSYEPRKEGLLEPGKERLSSAKVDDEWFKKQDTRDHSSHAKKQFKIHSDRDSEGNRTNEDEIDVSSGSYAKRTSENNRSSGSALEEKTPSTAEDNEPSRKRKVGRLDISPSWDVNENPSKRNKVVPGSEKDVSQLVLSARSKTATSIAPVDHSKKRKHDEGIWNRTEDRHSLNDSNCPMFYQRPGDQNTSTQRLLRLANPDDLIDLSGRKLGKCFQKRYTKIPRRVDLRDADDTWSVKKDAESSRMYEDEGAGTSHKVSPNSIRKTKHLLRV